MSEFILSQVAAPSNIALVKYMGKQDASLNIPENSSISMTLRGLCSVAEVLEVGGGAGGLQWVPDAPSIRSQQVSPYEGKVPSLDAKGRARIEAHALRVIAELPLIFEKYSQTFGFRFRTRSGTLALRTLNTFPTASGIASSASSFAAMTLALTLAHVDDQHSFEIAWKESTSLREELANLSRKGSGSSGRSLMGPWVLWNAERIVPLKASQMPLMAHFVIVMEAGAKAVSSSLAHQSVKTSPLWSGRSQRANERVEKMKVALENGDLLTVSRLAWLETWEMHSLFHTCEVPFSYWTGDTLNALKWFSGWMGQAESPIVTLDAGPNLHVLVKMEHQAEWRERLKQQFGQQTLLEDQQGSGPVFL